MSAPLYTEVPFNFLGSKLDNNFILLVTATQTETFHLHSNLKPIDDGGLIYKIYKNNLTYFVGTIGIYNVVHVQCGMGSVSRDASLSTMKDAVVDLNPKVVIMIGIAFGINKKKQSIGDVLISESIIPYEFSKIGEINIQRSPSALASKLLVNRFKNNLDWIHILPDNKTAKIYVTDILSGEKLIDNIKFRNNLKLLIQQPMVERWKGQAYLWLVKRLIGY